MTHFIARFPQHNNLVQDPKPEDYRDAAEWYRQLADKLRGGNLLLSCRSMESKSEKFEATYRRIKWAQGIAVRRDEAERA